MERETILFEVTEHMATITLRTGLVTEVVPRAVPREHAPDVALSIAERDTKAIQGTVRAIWESLDMPRTTAIYNGYSSTEIGNPPPEEVHISKGKGETRYR